MPERDSALIGEGDRTTTAKRVPRLATSETLAPSQLQTCLRSLAGIGRSRRRAAAFVRKEPQGGGIAALMRWPLSCH